MQLHIRPATPDDYPTVSAINNLIYPEYPVTADEIAYWVEHNDARCLHERWIVERDGRIVGLCNYGQSPEWFHPHKFWMGINVHPDYQRQGIGSTLYNHLLVGLAPHQPQSLRSSLREDQIAGIHFLEARGFRNVWHSWESRLDVQGFDPTPYAGLEEQLRTQGIEIKTLEELEGDPQRNRKMHALDSELALDIPTLDPFTPFTYEHYVDLFLNNPDLRADGFFVALENGEYIGETSLWHTKASKDLFQNLTAVKRSHRRRGIALALKVKAIIYAKEHGVPQVKTWNDHPNTGMIALNHKLGFVRDKAHYTFLKEF